MNIIIISASNPYKTAGIVAYDLYMALRKNHDTKILVKDYAKYNDNNIITIDNKIENFQKYLLLKFRGAKRKFFKHIYPKYKTKEQKLNNNFVYNYYFEHKSNKSVFSTAKILKRISFKPDIIIVLFMSGLVTFKNIFELQKHTNAKILLIPLDMAPFTGGCHYAWNCERYKFECENCQAINNNEFNNLAHDIYNYKKRYLQFSKLKIVAVSEQLFLQIKESSLLKNFDLTKILLPINEEVFKPNNSISAKLKLFLPTNKKIIFFGAVGINEKRKGYNFLLAALDKLKEIVNPKFTNQIHLAIAGQYNKDFSKIMPFPYTYLGFVDLNTLATIFQEVDVFINTSIEDSGPMMINQAIMSGVPVVAFNVGVATDLIISGKTGFLANKENSNELALGLKSIIELTETEFAAMSNNCRNMGINKCSRDIVASEIIEYITK